VGTTLKPLFQISNQIQDNNYNKRCVHAICYNIKDDRKIRCQNHL